MPRLRIKLLTGAGAEQDAPPTDKITDECKSGAGCPAYGFSSFYISQQFNKFANYDTLFLHEP